jgi:hypothetical protein
MIADRDQRPQNSMPLLPLSHLIIQPETEPETQETAIGAMKTT